MRNPFRLLCILLLLAVAASARHRRPVSLVPASQVVTSLQAALDRLYVCASLPRAKYECSFTESVGDVVNEIDTDPTPLKNAVHVNTSTTMIVHTHPMSASFLPSPHDVQIAMQTGIPNYVLSVWQLWVALPNGEVKRVGNVRWKHGHVEISGSKLAMLFSLLPKR